MSSSIKSARTLGLAGLVAAMAMVIVASVGAASASAANPEFSKSGVCAEAANVAGWPAFTKADIWWYNTNKEHKCETHEAPAVEFALGKGAFGLSPFYSERAGGPEPTLETVGKRTIKCENEQDIGETTAARVQRTVVRFSGKCHSTAFGAGECHSAGEPVGTITTKLLAAKPVWLGSGEKDSEGVGIALSPASGTLFAEFTCSTFLGNETIKVGVKSTEPNGKDSIVCQITPTNTVTNTFTLTCARKGTESGIQKYTGYYEGAKFVTDYLETEGKGPEEFTWEQSSQETTASITAAESGEIK